VHTTKNEKKSNSVAIDWIFKVIITKRSKVILKGA